MTKSLLLLLGLYTAGCRAPIDPPARPSATPAAAARAAAAPAPTDTERDLSRFFTGHEGGFVIYDVRAEAYTRYNRPHCRERFRPQSTRKIPEGLIGLETGAIPDPDHPLKWDGTRHFIQAHNRDHSLRTAFAASTNWFFEAVNARVGRDRVQEYFRAFRYGSQELGDPGAPYGDDALRISPDEQIDFLLRLFRKELPVSRRAQELMHDVMLARKTPRRTLRGKTGTGGRTADGEPRRPDSAMVATHGWYVGWVEHQGNAQIFALHLSGGKDPSGQKARAIAEKILAAEGWL